MGDFAEDTAVEPIGEGRYRAHISKDWMTWGPNGGYVSAIALRAAGAASRFDRPVSYACQYLRVGQFDAVELEVRTLHGGRSTDALQVSMRQGDEHLLEASVWAAAQNEGLVHDYTGMPDVPPPDGLPDMVALVGEQRAKIGAFRNFERRPLGWVPDQEDPEPREPTTRGWFRFQPRATSEDAFADAGRSVILIDSFSWPAVWPAHPSKGPLPWIAPNLDLHVRFHQSAADSDWLFCDSRAELAKEGLIGTEGRVWTPDGRLIASGSSQLLCRPRPERFR